MALVDRHRRLQGLLLIPLGLVISVVEMVGALLVFSLLGVVAGGDNGLAVPVFGTLEERFPGTDETTLFTYAAIFTAVFFMCRGALYIGQAYVQNRIAHNAGVLLSTRLLRGYLNMPHPFHLRRNSAELIRNAQESVNSLVGSVFVPTIAAAAEILLVIGVVLGLLVQAWAETLVTVAILGPIVFVLLRTLQPRLAALGATNIDSYTASLKSLQQSLHLARDIKLLGRAAFFEAQFERARARLARTYYLKFTLAEVPRIALETVLVGFILGFLAVKTASGGSAEASLPTLGLFAYAALRVMPALNRIVGHLNSLRFATQAVDYVYDDIQLIGAAEGWSDVQVDDRPFEDRLLVDRVWFRYDPEGLDVLRDVTLTVRRGESVGFVGPTGGGKSTLIDVLLGLLEPTAGTVNVDGRNLHEDTKAWWRQIGVVPQSIVLVDDTLRNNIALGLEADEIDEARLAEAVRMAQLESFVVELEDGLDTVVGEHGVRLSGGQRQRVAIARALYRAPAVLFFDEGTSALDTVTEADLVRSLERLRGERTLLTVAHRLSTVRACDRIYVLRDGQITDSGTFEELVQRNEEFQQLTR